MLKGWSPERPDADLIEKHGHSPAHDYLTTLVANRSCQWLAYEHEHNPEKPKLLTVHFPAPHGPEDAAPPWQGVFNTTKPPILNENYNYVNNEKKHHVLRKDIDFELLTLMCFLTSEKKRQQT